ncbi:MAG TPA: hypothetical protein VFE13_15185 [Caulobacteraceae bacterium]|nr:hypothetical protein [Caulobacteraceae bacterium]
MKVLKFIICLLRGHVWRSSRRRPGYETCMRCRTRRRKGLAA